MRLSLTLGWGTRISVCIVTADRELGNFSSFHRWDTDVPSLDDRALSNRESERIATATRRIKLASIRLQSTYNDWILTHNKL